MRREVATHDKVIKVYEHLKKVITIDEDGYVNYPTGMDDGSVAKALEVANSTVEKMRIKHFGRIRAERRDSRVDDLIKMIDELKARCDVQTRHYSELKRLHEDLVQRFDKLCVGISLKGGVDARHLIVNQNQLPLSRPPLQG